MKFIMDVISTRYRSVEVEADSLDEAKTAAFQMCLEEEDWGSLVSDEITEGEE